jgi:hypothetical protein
MYVTLSVVTVVLAAITLSLTLAHALEWPGKMRLSREQYLVVQPIYYPGFTIGGGAEPLVIVAVAALLAMTSYGSVQFWLIAGALAALVAMHLIFWVMTQPVNKVWVKDVKLGASASTFFGAGGSLPERDWTELRDRWEHSHLLRAAAAMLGLILLATAVAL